MLYRKIRKSSPGHLMINIKTKIDENIKKQRL